MMRLRVLACVVLTFGIVAAPRAAAQGEPLPFRRAMELAARNSTATLASEAESVRAKQELERLRGLYLPQATMGSGLAYSAGFPLSLEGSAPSLFNVQSSQLLYNAPQREFVRSARASARAAELDRDRSRNDVLLETASAYLELNKLERTQAALREQSGTAALLERVVTERVREGVDSAQELTRARLASARLRLRQAEAREAVDVLRLRLAQLTGLDAQKIQTEAASVPQLPALEGSAEMAAIEQNPAVQVAEEQARARELWAKGEAKWRYPSVDVVGQYALLSRFNNYDEFYNRFQRHNGTFGLVFRLPFLNFSQAARAEAAQAEARAARSEADAVRQRVSTEVLRMRRAVERMQAASEVAQLEYQLAQGEAESARLLAEDGATTAREREIAILRAQEFQTQVLEAEFALQRAQLQLMHQLNQLEEWALGN